MSIETWTTERVEQLQSFVVAGMSCSQIAAQIGVTRNAVIGKIHRLGLSPVRPPGAMSRNCPPGARDPRAASQRRQLRLLWSDGAATRQTDAASDTVESAAPCSLLDLAHGTCRWPVSDAAGNSGERFRILRQRRNRRPVLLRGPRPHGVPRIGAAAGLAPRSAISRRDRRSSPWRRGSAEGRRPRAPGSATLRRAAATGRRPAFPVRRQMPYPSSWRRRRGVTP